MLERAVKIETSFAVPGRLSIEMDSVTGSGVVFYSSTNRSLVLTANHVCNPEKELKLPQALMRAIHVKRLLGGSMTADVLWSDEAEDICVVVVDGYAGPAARVGELPMLGGMVYWPGGPFGMFGDGIGFLEQGHFAGHTKVNGIDRILIAGTTAHGASGSGLFYQDQLIGVVIATLQESGYLVVATGLDTVRHAISVGLNSLETVDAGP